MKFRVIAASVLSVSTLSASPASAGPTPSVPGVLPAQHAFLTNPAVLDLGPDGTVYSGREDNGDFVPA